MAFKPVLAHESHVSCVFNIAGFSEIGMIPCIQILYPEALYFCKMQRAHDDKEHKNRRQFCIRLHV